MNERSLPIHAFLVPLPAVPARHSVNPAHTILFLDLAPGSGTQSTITNSAKAQVGQLIQRRKGLGQTTSNAA